MKSEDIRPKIEKEVLKHLFKASHIKVKEVDKACSIIGFDLQSAYLISEELFYELWDSIYREVKNKFSEKCNTLRKKQIVERAIEFYLYKYLPTTSEDLFNTFKKVASRELVEAIRDLGFKYPEMLRKSI